MTILFGNILCAVGALFSFYATYRLGCSNNTKVVFKFSGMASLLVGVGSVVIGSWPTVFLNIVWLSLSVMGYLGKSMPKCFSVLSNALCVFVVIGVAAILSGQFSLAAIACASIYIVSYSAFAGSLISRSKYLMWGLIGYVLFVGHLYEVQNYSVLIMETISFILGIISLIKIRLLENVNFN
tara:strand:+ start:368 stop:913 length:546 start_codon:yes stop_codon:yes gene_type:complete